METTTYVLTGTCARMCVQPEILAHELQPIPKPSALFNFFCTKEVNLKHCDVG